MNKMTESQIEFIQKLKANVSQDLHIYGSITRFDYIPQKSDIDLDIFSENIPSTISTLCAILDIPKEKIKSIILKLNEIVVKGHKLSYKNPIDNSAFEISIYNSKDKLLILDDHKTDDRMPFYIVGILFVIKFLYYIVGILPNSVYKRCKQFLMNNNDELKFIQTDL